MTILTDRLQKAYEEETNMERKALLADCWVEINRFGIVVSQVRNLRAAINQIPYAP